MKEKLRLPRAEKSTDEKPSQRMELPRASSKKGEGFGSTYKWLVP